jgi:chromatin structure-remodeling complex protein RSC7
MYPQSHRVKIDKEGNMADVEDDETIIPEDPEGEKKVDKDGNLLGGREYRVRTFTILNRKNRLYMLSTEPARCCGFRDSYLFFTKHLKLHKVIIEEDEKMDLISRDVIPHSYKGRAIGVVTARSVFREFGAKIVVGGKKVTDDYYETEMRARGEVEGEFADPYDTLPAPGEKYNINQYVACHGASAVYHKDGPAMPTANGKMVPKRRVQITGANWQLEHALAARYGINCQEKLLTCSSRFNSSLVTKRKLAWDGVYDPHTNLMHYPKNSQPTHAKWEVIPREEDEQASKQKLLTNGTNGHVEQSIFRPLSNVIARNFVVTDVVSVSPPISGFAVPGSNSMGFDVGANGLPDVTPEILEDLPEDCRKALLEAKAAERQWTSQWSTEKQDGMRAKLEISYLGFPV